MIDKQTVTLEDLIGEHWLTGVDMDVVQVPYWDDNMQDARSISFRLDGKTYTAIEDANDGYRSCMGELYVDNTKLKNKFNKVKVVVKFALSDDWGSNDYLEFIDVKNGEVIMEVGTANVDDYYPSFRDTFYPERMHVNSKVKK